MKFALALASVLLVSPGFAADLPPDLAQQVHDYEQARLSKDGAVLNRVLADDFMEVGGAGRVESKTSFVTSYLDPNYTRLPSANENTAQTIWDDGAVLTGETTGKWIMSGKPGEQHYRMPMSGRNAAGNGGSSTRR